MSSRVFISHSTQDKDIADAVLSYLESSGLKCWIAPRDIPPGSDWAESLIDGIDCSSGLVLILSQHSNKSPQVRREIERAVSKGITIYPLVIEKLQLSKWMQYYISAHQWHDASETPLSKALIALVDAIKTDQDTSETEPDLSDLSALLEDDLNRLSTMLEENEEETVLLIPGERRKAAVLHITFSLRNEDKLPYSVRKTISKTAQNLIEKYTRSYGAHLDNLSPSEHRGIFGLEKAVENDVSRALTCGIQLFNGFSELNSVLRRKNLSIEFGLGVSTGTLEVVKTASESIDIRGDFLSKAKNLAESASNEILASSSVYKLSKDSFTWEEYGEDSYRISDYSLAVPGSRVLTVRSPFVGREEELSRLRSVLDQQEAGTEKNRRGGAKHLVMGISGEAGIGKSRLVHEFLETDCTGDDLLVVKGQTLSYAQPSYWLWTTLLRNLLDIEHGSDLSYTEFISKLQEYTKDDELHNSSPFLSELLSIKSGDKRFEELDDKAIVLETKIAFRNLFKALSDKQKLIVVLEDLHWIDESSKAALEFVLGNCDSETAIVFFLVYRPENEDGTSVEYEFHSNYAVTDEVNVEEVSDTASEKLIDILLSSIGNAASPLEASDEVKAFLLERSKGNPFYLEELVLDLVENGILIQTDQQWQFDRQPEDIHVPDSLTGLLQSRLDRLPESWRSVLQNSSVLGMEFQLKLYTMMVNKLQLSRPRSEAFDGLKKKQMLLSETSAFKKKYLFRHILVHDTAYSSILPENLKNLHRATAEAVEESYEGELSQVSGILMHHWEKAGNNYKALHWGLIALEKSGKNYRNEEVLILADKLEGLIEVFRPEDDEKLFKILQFKEESLSILGRRDEQRLTIQRMMELAGRSGRHDWRAYSFLKHGTLSSQTGHSDDAFSYYKESLAIARDVGDRHIEGQTLGNIGYLHLQHGRMEEGLSFTEESLAIHREVGNRRSEGISLGNIGILYKQQGRIEEGLTLYEEALAIHREVGNRRSEGMTLGNLGNLHEQQGCVEEAISHYEAALAIHREIGNHRSEGITMGNIGVLYHQQGRIEEARSHYEEATTIVREVGDLRFEGMTLVNIGLLHESQGRIEDAMTCYEEALLMHREVGNRLYEGITLGNIGLLQEQYGNAEEALAYYEEALAISREVGDRRSEVITLGNIGRSYALHGCMEEALNLYSQSYKVIRDIKVVKEDCEAFMELREELLSAGYSADEVPWPEHWEPIDGKSRKGNDK